MSKIILPYEDNLFHCIEADPPWRFRDRNYNGYESVQRYRIHCSYPTMPTSEILDMEEEIKRVSSSTCHLWLWSTKDFLDDAFEVLETWGFAFRQIFTWIKTTKDLKSYTKSIIRDIKQSGIKLSTKQIQSIADSITNRSQEYLSLYGKPTYGMGYWGRNGCEYLLFGTNTKSYRPKGFTSLPNYFFATRPRVQRTVIEKGEIKKITRQHSYKPQEGYDLIVNHSREPRLSLFQRRPKDG